MIVLLSLFITVFSFGSDKCKQFNDLITNNKPILESSVDDAYECITSIQLNQQDKTDIMNQFTEVIEAYAFKDILKSPPNESENKTYHYYCDIDQEIKTIKETQYSSFYDWFYSMQILIQKTHDLHLAFSLNKETNHEYQNILNFQYYLPFHFYLIGKDVYILSNDYFKQLGIQVPSEIEEYQEKKVVSINGKDPLSFIREFGERFTGLKSPHAKFTYAQNVIAFDTLASSTVTKEYLKTDILVQYENVENVIKYNYRMIFVNPNKLSMKAQKNFKNHLKNTHRKVLKIEDIVETEELYEKKQQLKQKQLKEKKEKELNIKMVSEQREDIYCYIDETNKVNTLVLTKFYPEEIDSEELMNSNGASSLDLSKGLESFLEAAMNCATSFDENTYPIQIILPLNGGGISYIGQFVEKIFAPSDDVSIIGSMRISPLSEKIAKSRYGITLRNTEECSFQQDLFNSETLGSWYTNPVNIQYGNETHSITKPSLMPYIELYNFKMKNQRKPSEIVVYTDAFCYSCCSIFTKGIKEHGSAIIVGYNGDPSLEGVKEFDVGQAPSAVESVDTYYTTPETSAMKRLGFTMTFTFIESFRYNYQYNEKYPREFLIDEIDVRSPINEFNEETRSAFSEYTNKVVQMYQSQCNAENKRLVKIDNKCDEGMKQKDEHARGGYVCGNDNQWSEECVIANCEEGYLFDFDQQKCIDDICYLFHNKLITMIIVIVIVALVADCIITLLVVICLILCVCYCAKKGKNKKSEYNPIEQMETEDNDNNEKIETKEINENDDIPNETTQLKEVEITISN